MAGRLLLDAPANAVISAPASFPLEAWRSDDVGGAVDQEPHAGRERFAFKLAMMPGAHPPSFGAHEFVPERDVNPYAVRTRDRVA